MNHMEYWTSVEERLADLYDWSSEELAMALAQGSSQHLAYADTLNRTVRGVGQKVTSIIDNQGGAPHPSWSRMVLQQVFDNQPMVPVTLKAKCVEELVAVFGLEALQ